jgi:sugar phosphate isomerase/epimerase
MKLSQVALQLYTLRDYCKTAADYAATLKKVKAIGYPAIQISGVGPMPEGELRSIAEGEGLVICATHESSNEIRNNPAKVIERLVKLGVTQTAYPYPSDVKFAEWASVKSLIDDLERAGAAFTAAGLTLSYHNHAIEFVKVEGKTILDHIYDETNPAHLQGELDTFWVHYGGGDVVEWCRRLKGRLPLIHLKDYQFTLENKHAFSEVGAGNLNFKKIVAAAEESGCQWFIVEQDSCPGDPFVSIQQSFDYIKAHLV